MARRADTYLGAAAALVAVSLIAVMGYRTLRSGDDGDGGGGGGEVEPPSRGVVGPELIRLDHLTDPDYKFTLTAPGPEWEVLDRAACDPIWFGQIAALHGARAQLQVWIERAGDLALPVAQKRVEDWLGKPVTSSRELQWLGRDVIELEIDNRRERLFVRDGMLHVISIVRSAIAPTWADVDVDKLWGAFALVDGTPHATTPTYPPRDQVGVGWRYDRGTWDSAAAGLTITPPSGWRLMTGRALGEELDVELGNDACGCYITVDSDVGPRAPPARGARTAAVDVAGARMTMVARELAPIDSTEVWDGELVLANGLRVAFQGWYPRADADTALPELRRAFAAIVEMPGPSREALARALARPRFDPAGIGPTWALRNGTYADYDRGLVWRQPTGFWQILIGARAEAVLEGAVLVASEPLLQVTIFVVGDDQVAEADHSPSRWVSDHIGREVSRVTSDPSTPRLGDGYEATWVDDAGAVHLHRVAAMIGTRHSFRVHVGGLASNVRAHEAELTAALAGLDVRTELAPSSKVGNVFEDRRYGYRLELPAEWVTEERGDDGNLVDRTWVVGDREMIGVVAEIAHGGPDQLYTQLRGRLTASAAAGDGTAPRPHRTRGVLAGEDATKLAWREGATLVTVFLVEHDHVLYTAYTRGTSETVETLRRAFKFVPRPD